MPLTARVTGAAVRDTPVASAVAVHPGAWPSAIGHTGSISSRSPPSAAPPVPSAGVGNAKAADTCGLPAAQPDQAVGGRRRRPQLSASAGRRLGNSRRSCCSASGPGVTRRPAARAWSSSSNAGAARRSRSLSTAQRTVTSLTNERHRPIGWVALVGSSVGLRRRNVQLWHQTAYVSPKRAPHCIPHIHLNTTLQPLHLSHP
jgi:hypothetical protein